MSQFDMQQCVRSDLTYLLSTVNLPENLGYDLMTPVFHDSDPSRVDFVRKISSTSFISSWLVDTISHILLFMILVCYRSITYSYSCVSQLGAVVMVEKKNCQPSTRLMGTKTLGWVSPRDRASVSLVGFYLLTHVFGYKAHISRGETHPKSRGNIMISFSM